MKKLLSVALAVGLVFMSACTPKQEPAATSGSAVISSETALPEEKTITAREIKVTDDAENKNKKMFSVNRGGFELSGVIYLPEGDGPFPVVFFAGGLGADYRYLADIAKEQSDNGVAAVLFNFAGVSHIDELTVLKEAEDLKAVIGGVRTLSYIDSSKVFLWGHSLGGLVASYVGCKFPDEIKGMVLVEPAYAMKDQIKKDYPDLSAVPASVYSKGFIDDLFSFDIYDYMAAFKGNVVIFLGTTSGAAGTISPEYFERAAKLYPSAEIVRIQGANHNFQPKGWDELIKGTTEFLKKNI